MRRLQWVPLALLLCLACIPAVAAGEIVIVDGVRYELMNDAAWIAGIEEGVTSVVVHPQVEGLPTRMTADSENLGVGLEEIVFAEGVEALVPYHLLLSHVRHITLPGSFDLAQETDSSYGSGSFFEYAGFLQSLSLPAAMLEDNIVQLAKWADGQYWSSQYDLKDIGIFRDPYDPAINRSFRSLFIDPNHPTLYDIDGIVYTKGTSVLTICPSARVGAVAVPEGTTAIGPAALASCNRIESIALPRSLSVIGPSAFSGCASLRTIQLPPTLETIGKDAFSNCSSLVSIVIPDGVTIEAGAFDYCLALREVYIQGSTSTIDPTAFDRCRSDLVIYAKRDTPGHDAALRGSMLWAEPGGEPERLVTPYRVHKSPAYIHAKDERAALPLYANPSISADKVATLAVGTTIDMLDTEDGWAHIRLVDAEGYMPLDQLASIDLTVQLERVLAVQTEDESKHLYAAPSLDAEKMPIETWHRYAVTEQFGAWYRLEEDGVPWYVPVSDVVSFGMNLRPDRIGIVACKAEQKRAKLYASNSEQSEVIGEFYSGTQLILIERVYDGLSHVSIDGQEGYMKSDNINNIADEWFYYAY